MEDTPVAPVGAVGSLVTTGCSAVPLLALFAPISWKALRLLAAHTTQSRLTAHLDTHGDMERGCCATVAPVEVTSFPPVDAWVWCVACPTHDAKPVSGTASLARCLSAQI
jgi:hypothetical protein